MHSQPQEGLSRVGVHVPVGRLSADECRQIADLADKYSDGEVRLTVEENLILPNVKEEHLAALLASPCLSGDSRLSVSPGKIAGNVVSCTGAQFCGFAQIETKKSAYATAEHLESVLDFPNGDLRMIWTGCPNSCAPVQVADIGIMGAQVKNPAPGGKGGPTRRTTFL